MKEENMNEAQGLPGAAKFNNETSRENAQNAQKMGFLFLRLLCFFAAIFPVNWSPGSQTNLNHVKLS